MLESEVLRRIIKQENLKSKFKCIDVLATMKNYIKKISIWLPTGVFLNSFLGMQKPYIRHSYRITNHSHRAHLFVDVIMEIIDVPIPSNTHVLHIFITKMKTKRIGTVSFAYIPTKYPQYVYTGWYGLAG